MYLWQLICLELNVLAPPTSWAPAPPTAGSVTTCDGKAVFKDLYLPPPTLPGPMPHPGGGEEGAEPGVVVKHSKHKLTKDKSCGPANAQTYCPAGQLAGRSFHPSLLNPSHPSPSPFLPSPTHRYLLAICGRCDRSSLSERTR